MKKIVGISLALIMVLGSVPLGWADSFPECKNLAHLVVLRSNGDYVCLTEKTAQRSVERLGWEVIPVPHTTKVGTEGNTELNIEDVTEEEYNNKIVEKLQTAKEKNLEIPIGGYPTHEEAVEFIEKQTSEDEPKIEKTIEPILQKKVNLIKSATDLSYLDLEKIPNPEGYWVPIEDRDAFAHKFANAAGEEITHVNKYGNADYFTTNGRINLSELFVTSSVWSSVSYRIYELESMKESQSEQLQFITDFMNNMGFKLSGNTLSLTESYLETCEGNFYLRACELDDNSKITKNTDTNHVSYKITSEFSKIKFTFFGKSHAYYGSHVIHIEFDGWTNHPELIEFPLDKNIVIEKAREFVLANEYLNKPSSEGGTCDLQIQATDDYYFRVYKFVIGGIPFYGTNIAECTYDPTGTNSIEYPLILVDARTGEYVFLDFRGGWD